MLKHLTTNLFVPVPETTMSGVTLTHADDGSFILNGTCTQDRYIYTTAPIKAGSYLLCSIDSDISDTTEIRLRNNGTAIAQFTLGAQSRSVAFTVSEDIAVLQYSIRMGNGTVYSNFKVKPMLFKDVSTAPSQYIPYLNTPPEMHIATENLCSIVNKTDIGWAYLNSDFLTFFNSLPAGTYTWSMKYTLTQRNDTSDASCYGLRATNPIDTFGSNHISWDTAGVGTSKTYTETFTITDAMVGTFSAVYTYGCGVNGVGASGKADITEIMVVKGTTAPSSYVPYGYHYIGEMYKKSANLLNETLLILGYIDDNGVQQGSATAYLSPLIECEANTTYTISSYTLKAGGYTRIHAFDANGTWISMIGKSAVSTVGATIAVSGTTPSTAKYIRVSGYLYSDGGENAMLVEGSTIPTEYVAYGFQCIFSAGHDQTVTGNPLTMSDARPLGISYEFTGNAKRTIEIDGTEYVVPDGYTLLDYVYQDGVTTPINTGITIDLATTKILFDGCELTPRSLFGTAVINYVGITGTSGTYRFDYNGSNRVLSATLGATRYKFLIDANKCYVDGTLEAEFTQQTGLSSYPLYLFARINSDPGVNDPSNDARCYAFAVWVDGVNLSLYYQPAKRNFDNVAGFYDFVSGSFIVPSSNALSAGNELPTPDNQLGVIGCGDQTANLYDKNTNPSVRGYPTASGTWSTGSYERSIILKLEEGQTYTIVRSADYGANLRIAANSSSTFTHGQTLEPIYLSGGTTLTTYTFSVPVGYPYVAVYIMNTSPVTEEMIAIAEGAFMCVKGSTAPSSYIPYGYKFPILKAENCGKVDLGTLNWSLNTTVVSGITLFTAVYTDKLPGVINMFCSDYPLSSSLYTIADKECYGRNANATIYFRNDSCSTAEDFKSAVSGVYLYYQRTTDSSWTAPTISNIYDDSQLYKVGTYIDTIESDGVRTNNVGKVVFDGTETWTYDSTYSRFRITISDVISSSAARTIPGYCTHFEILSSAEAISSVVTGQAYFGDTSSTKYIYFHASQTSVSDWTTWLATQAANGTPVTVYYPLATPTTETLTTPSITNARGVNYLQCNTEVAPSELSATYRKRTA